MFLPHKMLPVEQLDENQKLIEAIGIIIRPEKVGVPPRPGRRSPEPKCRENSNRGRGSPLPNCRKEN